MKKKLKQIRKRDIFNVLGIIFTLICLFSLTLLSYFIFKLDIIPTKYLMIGFSIFILAILILIFTIFGRMKKIVKIIALAIMMFISIVFSLIAFYLNNTYHFLSSTQSKSDKLTYSVVVLKNSSYSSIDSLKNKTISYLNDDHKSSIKENINTKINFKESLLDDFSNLLDKLLNKEVDSIILEEGYLTLAYEEVEDFENKIKVIYNFEIEIDSHKEEGKSDVTKEPFIVYVSGIDQYGNVNSVRGRSDVNQLLVINPITNKILIVNTPRDYYVRLAGTTGLKDKLTHAGIYGINKSVATLENLYDIDIDNYIRVNFNTLIKAVDIIGGIDVYSDKTFNSYHIKGWTVKKGWNHFNGKQALAYSRERYAYVDGDHHRGRNQQDVITAIIEKVTKSSVLISKYNSILNSLDKSFQTDIDTKTITSFIKYQLDKMPTWEIESIAAYGYNSYNYTYSMGYNYKLYVMEPDYNSINKVKNKIIETLNEK